MVKRFISIIWNIGLWVILSMCSVYHQTTIYLIRQSVGQLSVLVNTQTFEAYILQNNPNALQLKKMELIRKVKEFSVDSLGFKPTRNFNSIYNQGKEPVLWVITASEKYSLRAFYWVFPVVGKVSYKGFFDKTKAISEQNRLICEGYDVDLRPVSAWSTLGWFSDPVLSSMLDKTDGNLCNLIFHELFHATYYAESSVDYNENLASFVAHKSTIRFLQRDTGELRSYEKNYSDNRLIEKHISSRTRELNGFYDSISGFSTETKQLLKLKKLHEITASLDRVKLNNPNKIKSLKANITAYKNAWFIDYKQYSGLQDSLEAVFNKFYQSDLAKMVQSLK